MSFWIRPTTADIGIRAFGRNQNDLLREMTLGMQSILLDDDNDLNSLTRKAARWEVMHDGDVEILVVKWLDEVLYRAEVHNEYLVDCQPMIRDGIIESQVSFVSKDDVNYEIEITTCNGDKSLRAKQRTRTKTSAQKCWMTAII